MTVVAEPRCAALLLSPLTPEQETILDLWADALDSDEYVQGRSVLAGWRVDELQHCCLGVLCEVLHKNNLLPPGWTWDGIVLTETKTGNIWSAVPPLPVMQVVFGANEDRRSSMADRFARANDAHAMPFARISSEIRDRTFFVDMAQV